MGMPTPLFLTLSMVVTTAAATAAATITSTSCVYRFAVAPATTPLQACSGTSNGISNTNLCKLQCGDNDCCSNNNSTNSPLCKLKYDGSNYYSNTSTSPLSTGLSTATMTAHGSSKFEYGGSNYCSNNGSSSNILLFI
jgi:curli biogenesis system outer membrane secretion channel CsgG